MGRVSLAQEKKGSDGIRLTESKPAVRGGEQDLAVLPLAVVAPEVAPRGLGGVDLVDDLVLARRVEVASVDDGGNVAARAGEQLGSAKEAMVETVVFECSRSGAGNVALNIEGVTRRLTDGQSDGMGYSKVSA
jgi:hypothetical protein